MKNRKPHTRNTILFLLLLIFAVLALAVGRGIRLPFPLLAALAIAFGVLGVVLTVVTGRYGESRTQKRLFILTGVSATGMPVCVILHNLVYGLFIALFGEGFWGPGGDEPLFFVLAVIVFPALFLIGAVASVILILKERMRKNASHGLPLS